MKTIRLIPIFLLIMIAGALTGQEKTIYWVGGQGNWSDLNKWRTPEGLLPEETPDENTNVIFNENSFLFPYDTVFITIGNPACKNMIWENIPFPVVMFSNYNPQANFNIFGSLTFHPNVINKYMGITRFTSSQAGNTITLAGPETRFNNHIWFDGFGEWTLMDTLLVFDTAAWQIFIPTEDPWLPFEYDEEEMPIVFPEIYHVNGTLNANGFPIISRGFSSSGNLARTLNIPNIDVFISGVWLINAENLSFNASNTNIWIAGSMIHNNGTNLVYHDINLLAPVGVIRNNSIRTTHRYVHFRGGGTLNGNRNPGAEGSFTIDTVIMEGFMTMMGPIPNEIFGRYNDIHYAQLNWTPGETNMNDSYIHRIDFNGGGRQFMRGLRNDYDSVHFFFSPAYVIGKHDVNNFLFFKTDGVITAEEGYVNEINHAVFAGDGIFERNNHFNRLTLQQGHMYQLQTDSLIHPGSYSTSHFKQTVLQLEVTDSPGCDGGGTWISSKHKYTPAILEYLGPPITLKHIFLRDIMNTGATITIEDGWDFGNNEGFLFVDPVGSRTLYWVNGEGNWSDPNHWSLTSGGPGGECPPTFRDNVFFDGLSGFAGFDASGLFLEMDKKNMACNDFIWLPDVQNFPFVFGEDTNNFHVFGHFILDPAMTYGFFGTHYFVSEDEDEYKSLYIHYSFDGDEYFDLWNKTYFYSEKGKWRLDSDFFYNYIDTVYFKAGALLLEDQTMEVLNFNSNDTLYRELYLLGKTLVVVHQYQADAWLMLAWMVDEKMFFDSGESTIRATGYITPPPGADPGYCNIISRGGELVYHNIEFASEAQPGGVGSQLQSESMNTFNLVDYYITQGEAIGTGIVDTMTFHSLGDFPHNGYLRNQYFINFFYSYSPDNWVVNSCFIDSAFFYQRGRIYGGHFIGYLEAHEYMHVSIINQIDTAVFYGNATILGRNQFYQLVLTPGHQYWFQPDNETDLDTTIIINDLLLYGLCDAPIRIESDSAGVHAMFLYMAENPTNPDLFAQYASIRDITMLEYEDNQYVAENTVDLGNNTNIIFNPQPPGSDIYYWIGGTGNWGDAQNWSYTSGGPPISEQCVPNERITVVFDNNSFDSPNDIVTVDVKNAFIKSMYWVHDPDLFNPIFENEICEYFNVFGSVLLNPGMIYEFDGILVFDQFNEPGSLPDTLTTFGHTILNHIYLRGQSVYNFELILGDDLTMFNDPDGEISMGIFHEHGKFNTNGMNVYSGGYFSVFKNQRELNIENSTFTVESYEALMGEIDRAWWIDGDNFTLSAYNSNIINASISYAFITEYGEGLKYHNITVPGLFDSIANFHNVVEYNVVELVGPVNLITGNFIADTVWMKGQNCGMFMTSNTNVVILDGMSNSVNNNHTINRGIVNRYGIINGSNFFHYCVFNADGVFLGENAFDTLVLYPGSGDFENQGNKFYFQAGKDQIINDSLYVRGNPCSNISLISLGMPSLAWLRQDYGSFDISADFLNIYSVGAKSESITFYAGANSSPLPNPNNPPPGWIFDNALGYIPGFNGRTERFCLGEPYVIKADGFNGDPFTQYYWEGSLFPGGDSYTVTEPGQYHIRVVYFEGCFVDDYINVEPDFPPNAYIAEGPFCEGDPIVVYVEPAGGNYSFEWFNGSTSSYVPSDLNFPEGIYVTVIDNANNCKSTPNQTILVKPIPDPQTVLGVDITLKFGESITLDAGEGDYYEWSSTPEVPIDNPNSRYITVPGMIEPVEYHVYVEVDGCPAEGVKTVSMYPPSRLGVPTAFSPNGDGVNDVLYVLGSGFSDMIFRVYNRYGQMVFETRDSTIGWDGTYNGVKQEAEVYTYYIRVLYQDKDVVEETGNITLLR